MNIILVILQVRKTTHNYPRILFRKCLPPPVCVNFVQIHNRLLSFFLVIVIINMVCDCFSLLLSTLADSDASSWEAKGACFLRVHWFQFKPSLGHGEWEGTNLGVRERLKWGVGVGTQHTISISTAQLLISCTTYCVGVCGVMHGISLHKGLYSVPVWVQLSTAWLPLH